MMVCLSLVSNKYFLFSWAKTLKLWKEGKGYSGVNDHK